ncbi:MAG TPA: hypothetical protein DDY78_05345 [Planctomycetales bacterium]|jgi:hypothetical protein|nr:hypothetical protein [Planctomycetales bacterium]
MSSSQEQPPNAAPSRPSALAELAKHHKETGYVLIGLAVLWAVLPIYLLVKEAWLPKGSWANALGPVFFWAVAGSLITGVIGAAAVLATPGRKLGEVEIIRLLLLVLGGAVGIITALLGLALPFTHAYAPIFLGGVEEWRKQPVRLYIVAMALVGGLGLTFLSLQLSRGVERESALMRRLLYGFNAVFTTLLLGAVLLLVNLLPYVPKLSRYDFVTPIFAGTYDWTQSRLYSLSDRSRATLADLKAPLKIYVFLNAGGSTSEQVETLLENCRGVTPQISWETLSTLDQTRIQELGREYKAKITEEVMDFRGPQLRLREGMLVVYGDPSKEQTAFVPRTSLVKEDPSPDGGGGQEVFHGEGVLLKTIRSLTEGKQVVYFTQGDGELDFNDNKGDSIEGVGLLLTVLKQHEIYDLKEWKFTKETPKVPDDAEVVVAARPEKLKPDALKAIYEYMGYTYDEANSGLTEIPKGRHGRLFVLTGVSLENNQMVRSGLEPLLGKFGVQVGDDHVLTLQNPNRPTLIQVETSRKSANPVAKALGAPNRELFVFEDVRTVKALPGGGAVKAEELLVTASNPVWVQTDLTEKPSVAAAAKAKDANARFSDEPIIVAVAVSETGPAPGMPNDPIHSRAGGEAHPRLIVVGNADWISNLGLVSGRDGKMKYDLFTSCLSWLRGEPDIGASAVNLDEDKVRPRFTLSLSPDVSYNMWLLPLGHMILAVIAAGCGVWLVRRR